MTLLDLYTTFLCGTDNQKINTIVDKVQQLTESLPLVVNILNEISETFLKFSEQLSTDGIYEVVCSNLLLKIYYPPCLYLTRDQTKRVIDLLSDSENTESLPQVEAIIQTQYNNELVEKMLLKWKSKTKPQRFLILQEGIQSYINGFYYASNALLLTQIGGIISDNEFIFQQTGGTTLIERLKALQEEQRTMLEANGNSASKVRSILSSEKNKARRHLLINLQGSLCAFAKYFVTYLYRSGDVDFEILSSVANRNKVLHGDQCNFGNKEMALKTIIAVDILINLPDWQKKILEERENA